MLEVLRVIRETEDAVLTRVEEARRVAADLVAKAETEAEELVRAEHSTSRHEAQRMLAQADQERRARLARAKEESDLLAADLAQRAGAVMGEAVQLVVERIVGTNGRR